MSDDAEKILLTEDYKYVIMVFGKTGSGVSSTANSLLGKKAFRVGNGMNPITQEIQCETMTRERIQVIDMPDLVHMDRKNSASDQTCEKLLSEVLSKSGRVRPDAALLVIKSAKKYSSREYDIYKKLKTKLGDIISPDNLIVVFTRGKRFKEKYVQPANKELQYVLQDAGHRYVVLENSASDGDKEKDVCRLLTMVDRLRNPSAPDRIPERQNNSSKKCKSCC